MWYIGRVYAHLLEGLMSGKLRGETGPALLYSVLLLAAFNVPFLWSTTVMLCTGSVADNGMQCFNPFL